MIGYVFDAFETLETYNFFQHGLIGRLFLISV